MLRERSEGCKVCHPQFSNGILLPVNWRVHVFKLPVMIDLVSDEAHTVAKSLLDNTPNYLPIPSWARYPIEMYYTYSIHTFKLMGFLASTFLPLGLLVFIYPFNLPFHSASLKSAN